jgi:predicted dehydrogenase
MLESAYEYAADVKHRMTVNGRTRERVFPRHDQFAPELIAFSECVLDRVEPEPSGWEGLADVRIIRALYQSAREGHPVRLPPFERRSYPTRAQAIQRPAVPKPSLVKVREPG